MLSHGHASMASIAPSQSSLGASVEKGFDAPVRQRRYKSAIISGPQSKPWLKDSPNRKRVLLDKTILFCGIFIGLGIAGLLCYLSYKSVPQHDYCIVLDEDFSSGTIDKDIWVHHIQFDGFGTGSFDWTTDDEKNSYIDEEGLHIVPTLTTESTDITYEMLTNNYTVNLTETSCTAQTHYMSNFTSLNSSCTAHSNASLAQIINPIRSARLSTKGTKSIKYGRVEVVAKMPHGNWLWPAIWMMPVEETYGIWPASGEIDLGESRGNANSYVGGGKNRMSSTLHWGTDTTNDAWYKTTMEKILHRDDFGDDFHTYGVEWSEDYIFTWIDDRVTKVLQVDFGKKHGTMYERGKFSTLVTEGFVPPNVWADATGWNAPFDQEFYLILNVAVGSTTGYFSDGVDNKPWVDQSGTAMHDFWVANSTWLPTWGEGADRGMTVKSVKMWQEGKCK